MSFLIYPGEEGYMSGSGRADNGRGNNRRRQFRRRNKEGDEGAESSRVNNGSPGNSGSGGNSSFRTFQKPQEKKGRPRPSDDNQNRRNFNKTIDNSRGDKTPHPDRPKWIPPKVNNDPLPVPDCLYCGKPIQDISQAISDKDTGVPVHFDCVVNRIAGGENLEKEDSVTYIGGGRFGIVSFSGKTEFMIKKVIEWENKDKRAEWRSEICEHYMIT